MMRSVAALAAVVVLGLASFAQAAQLLSPPLPTPSRGTNIGTLGACRVRNVGTTPVTVTVAVFSNNGVVTTFDTCNTAALAAGKSCSVAANLPEDSFVSCRVTAASVSNLRGTLELSEVTSRHDVFAAEDLQ